MRLPPLRIEPVPAVTRGEASAVRRTRRIKAFHPSWQPLLADLTAHSSALEDLADSFPALLFALATGYNGEDARRHAVDLVHEGAPLRAVADALDLPWWLRRLTAAAFTDPLVLLPTSADFATRVSSLLPAEPSDGAIWLRAVSEAHLAGGPEFALWSARHGLALVGAMPEQRRALLVAWTWACLASGTHAHALVRRSWSSELGIKRTLEEFTAWVQRIELLEWLGSGRLKPWIRDAEMLGYRFTTLRTVEDYIATAEALDNCLEQYADRLRLGRCTVASISRNGKVVACVELSPHETDVSMPGIVQLRGARNRRASIDVWQATYAWLGAGPVDPFTSERLVPPAADRMETRRRLWSPYLEHLGSQHGGAAIEARMRRLLLHRNSLPSEGASLRLRRRAAAEVIHGEPRIGRRGIADGVLQRLIDILPGGDGRRGR
jgi:hypothetical protein